MFIRLFYTLRKFGVPVSTQELLDLNHAVAHDLAFADMQQFYQLARLILVKDERYFDKFDRAFQAYLQALPDVEIDDLLKQLNHIPKSWLDLELLEKNLTAGQRAQLQQANSLQELLQQLEQRLAEQHKKHQGGNRMIGTGGTSPFGAYGDHPQGIRIGGPSRKHRAVKVWEQRQYRNLDDDQILGSRQMQMALRRLRKFARQGTPLELDIDQTIQKTAQNGLLDIQLVAQRRNGIKVLMLFDVGGSMDAHIQQCEQLFTAAKQQFKSLDYFYFHNCIYDNVWKDNARRQASAFSTWDLLHKYGQDYCVIVVGDASMAPYELGAMGGSVEYMNEETGRVWLQRIYQHFKKIAWLNPETENYWQYTQTIGQIQQIFEQHMYPLSLNGLEQMTQYLAK
ncbi:vWA domain-containing protein [Acinetobacter sp. MD2(2019)]|uniref:vWA domain-containing protein n=1 Tax=Acinetobacter sp. MD2(2019) TaxID=2605273 RepID=UPI002D1E9315|nr:VWA domain-containing protein [Acinetobacter sp. MD2(2019)]MEB3752943.1 VWA domain-containing protein [Acinetobacter sp. MD2(2019)]